MAVPSSGQLQLRGDIALEVYGDATGNNISLGAMSDLAGFAEPDSMSDFYGYVAAAPPTVVTNASTSITGTTMTLNGNVTFDGDATVTERGFRFGTNGTDPTNNTKYTVSGTTGAYSLARTGLSTSTTYYVWAFATNSEGTSYGSRVTANTAAPFSPSYFAFNESNTTAGGYYLSSGNDYRVTHFYLNPDTSSYVQYGEYTDLNFQSSNIFDLERLTWVKTGITGSYVLNARNLRLDSSFQTYGRSGPSGAYPTPGLVDLTTFVGSGRSFSGISITGSTVNITNPSDFSVSVSLNQSYRTRWSYGSTNGYDTIANNDIRSEYYFNYV